MPPEGLPSQRPRLTNLSGCPHLDRKAVAYADTATLKSLLYTPDGNLVDNAKKKLIHSELSVILIRDMWKYIQRFPLHHEPRVHPGKHFWHNFRVYFLEIFHHSQEVWKEAMKIRQKRPLDTWEENDRALELYQVTEDISDEEMRHPDFACLVPSATRLLEVIERKFAEETGRKISDEEYLRSLNASPIKDEIFELMINSRASVKGFFKMIEVEPDFESPSAFPPDGISQIDAFDFDPETLCVHVNSEVAEIFREVATRKGTNDMKANCPLVYTKLFPEIWEWFLATFKFYRFGIPLPPHYPQSPSLQDSIAEYVRICSKELLHL